MYWLSKQGINVLFITNENSRVAIWNQKQGNPVVWDYHVVAIDKDHQFVYDYDSTLGFKTDSESYFDKSFKECSREYRPYLFLTKVYSRNMTRTISHIISTLIDRTWLNVLILDQQW